MINVYGHYHNNNKHPKVHNPPVYDQWNMLRDPTWQARSDLTFILPGSVHGYKYP